MGFRFNPIYSVEQVWIYDGKEGYALIGRARRGRRREEVPLASLKELVDDAVGRFNDAVVF
jgi:hypothetical protein